MVDIKKPADPFCILERCDRGLFIDFVFDPRFHVTEIVMNDVVSAVSGIGSFAAFSSIEAAKRSISKIAGSVVSKHLGSGVTYTTGSECYPPDGYIPVRSKGVFIGLSLLKNYEMHLEYFFHEPYLTVILIADGSVEYSPLKSGISYEHPGLWLAWLIAEERGLITSEGIVA